MASVLITGGTGMVGKCCSHRDARIRLAQPCSDYLVLTADITRIGSFITSIVRSAAPTNVSSVDILSRRAPAGDEKSAVRFNSFVEKDTEKWPTHIRSLSPAPSIYFSALATTRGNAGGFENQYKLEHDFNLELAKAAKESGVKTYVLISGANANAKSSFGYVRMKGEIEEEVKAMNFEHTIIVRPGLIAGYRQESRPMEAPIRWLAAGLGHISTHYLKDFWAQEAEVIAKAAVSTALKANSGQLKEKVVYLHAKEIIQYGREDWKDLR
jgi:hypothetical protein